jgi:hypothetical protein
MKSLYLILILFTSCYNYQNSKSKLANCISVKKYEIVIKNLINSDTFDNLYTFQIFSRSIFDKYYDTSQIKVDTDAIIILKISNTIASYSMLDIKMLNKSNEKLKLEGYNVKIMRLLNFKPTIGLGLYSEKYDIIWGGLKFPYKSYYYIRDTALR